MNRRKISLLLLTVMAISFSIQAQSWFPSGAFCQTNGVMAQCRIYNGSYYPIYCAGNISATTYYGYSLYGNMGLWIAPGTMGFSYPIYALSPYRDPIVGVWHDIWCRF